MKNFKSLIAALGLLLAASAAFGQAALTVTTLSGAVNASQTVISVASATGISAPSGLTGNTYGSQTGSMLFIEDGTSGTVGTTEAMLVTGINGTSISVVRGASATLGAAHISGAIVFVGRPDQFYALDPTGGCTATNTAVTPYINVKNGNQWLCSTVTNSWVPGFFNTASQTGVTASVASAAGPVNPSGPLFHVTGSVLAITAWGSSASAGLGSGGGSATSTIGANFCIIPDVAFTTTAGNNIAIGSTAVVSKTLCYTFDQTNKKYTPSY
jgi:hypothetical protein